MENIEIKGFKRKEIGKQNSKQLRRSANVPCALYGGKEQIHLFIPMSYINDFLYTPNIYFINIDFEGKKYKTILQDIQFHPVSDMVMHIDFLEIFEDKEIKIMVPTVFEGESIGISNGGMLIKKVRKLKIKGLPKNIPSKIPINISNLDLGDSSKVRDIKTGEYKIIMPPNTPTAAVVVPRVLRSKQDEGEEKPTEETTNEKASTEETTT